ncbi:hypothetical protein [Peribacillus sp. NPDC096540]|uniref:hypothetical protein n=1 Tax=Peribacillus sp. NPDC096540 TaxID=3390612 RepID=UPI003CFBEB5D
MNKTNRIVHLYIVDPLLDSAQDVGEAEAIHAVTSSVKKATNGFTTELSLKKVNPQNIKVRCDENFLILSA